MSRVEGFEVVLLLAGGFRSVVTALHRDLAEHGHAEARPVHGFALQAVGAEGCTITTLGQRLGVSKQAAAKTAHGLERAGYLSRRTDPDDRRAVVLVRTARADDLLARSERFFARWLEQTATEIGAERLETTIYVLRRLGCAAPVGDLPGWLLACS